MSKEVIAQYLADMEKDDFVFVHPTTEKDTAQEAEQEDGAKEAEVAATASSWADEVEEEIMAAEDQDAKHAGSWAAVAATAAPKPAGRWSNWISLKNITEQESTKPQNMNCSDLDQANLDPKRPNLVFDIN